MARLVVALTFGVQIPAVSLTHAHTRRARETVQRHVYVECSSVHISIYFFAFLVTLAIFFSVCVNVLVCVRPVSVASRTLTCKNKKREAKELLAVALWLVCRYSRGWMGWMCVCVYSQFLFSVRFWLAWSWTLNIVDRFGSLFVIIYNTLLTGVRVWVCAFIFILFCRSMFDVCLILVHTHILSATGTMVSPVDSIINK